MKRIISIVTALLLLISTVPINSTYAAADITKPVLKSISVDKKEATAGDIVKISIKASDDVGVNFIALKYYTPITQRFVDVQMDFNPQSNAFEGTISIESNTESGTFSIAALYIYDAAGNYLYLDQYSDSQNQLAGGDFLVSGTSGADIQRPVLESISVDKIDATAGDTVKVSLKATDDVGIDFIALKYYTPITKRFLDVPMNLNSQTNTYEGTITIGTDMESGTFTIASLYIYDTTGNYLYLDQYSDTQDQLAGGNFSVSGTSGGDMESPVLESISVDKNLAEIGDTVKIRIHATDNVGINHIVLRYYTPITKRFVDVQMSYNSQTNAYEGYMNIGEDFEPGVFSVAVLSIYDTTGNRFYLEQGSDLKNQLAGGKFRVITEHNPPTLVDFSGGGGGSIEAGDQLNFSADAVDDTKVEEVIFHYLSPSQKTMSVSLWNDGNGFFGEWMIYSDTEDGKWKLQSIEIIDVNLNKTVLKANETDLSRGDFTVLKPIVPMQAVVVKSYEFWSNKTVNSDVYVLPGGDLRTSTNVTINGNVYVLGGLRSGGGLRVNGSLIGKSFYFGGYFSPTNGQVILNGSNTVSSLIARNRIIEQVPFTVFDTPLVSTGGMVSLTGATLPFVSMEINGQSIGLREDGTFRLHDFYIGNSETLSVKLTDLNGYTYYHSYGVAGIYIDEVTKHTQAVSGKTAADSVVRIFENDRLIAEGGTDAGGHFAIPISGLVENAMLKFVVVNSTNEVLTTKEIFVKDTTAPAKPVVDAVTDQSTAVTGKAEPEAAVEVSYNGTVIGSGTAAVDGTFTVGIPVQKAGSELVVTAADKAGNVSDPASVIVLDVTAPEKPVVTVVKENDMTVTGTAGPGTKIEVALGTDVVGEGTAGTDGKFSVSIPAQKLGVELAVTAIDQAGNRSAAVLAIVTDGTPPEKPLVNGVTDQDLKVTGKAEAFSTIVVREKNGSVLGTVSAGDDGTFSVPLMSQPKGGAELHVTASDQNGNVSESAVVVVNDVTAPGKPAVNEVTENDSLVSGRAEAGAQVEVSVDDVVIGSGIAGEDGLFSVLIPVQQAGTSLKVTATDQAGNVSAAAVVVVTDVVAPAKPVVDAVTDNDSSVNGIAEAGAKVEVWAGSTVIGYGFAEENGRFAAAIPTQAGGTKLTITAKDSAGNVSEAAVVVVKDITAPARPQVNEVTDQDYVVSGAAEAGSKVEVWKDGLVIGSVVADAAGSFSVRIGVQKAGTSLAVTATDKSGNVSETTIVVVKDVIIPVDPEVNGITDMDKAVTGWAEPGSTVKVSLNDGTEIGSGVTAEDGRFSVSIPLQMAGTNLLIVSVDEAGNRSNTIFVEVKDVSIPGRPVVDEVTNRDDVVRGSAEPNATVEVWLNGSLLGSDHVWGDGYFVVRIPEQQAAGAELVVTITDRAGHVSEPARVVVKDAIAPARPIVNEVTTRSSIVSGQAEAYARVEVKNSAGALLGAAVVDGNGKFAVAIPLQSYGTELFVRVYDAAGNVSDAVSMVVGKAKLAGWVQDGGYWYYYDPVTFDVKLGWFKVGSKWYYADGYGKMQTGWLKIGPSWYYFGSSGAMATGWLKVGTVWYYFGTSGAMATGWLKLGSTWYYFGTSGAMKTGWLQSGQYWYYFKSSGAMAIGWVKIGSKSYYFDSNGVWRK